MKNPNTPVARLRTRLHERWSAEDYPGGDRRFQMLLFLKDSFVFIALPLVTTVAVKACESSASTGRRPPLVRPNAEIIRMDSSKSQIIVFVPQGSFARPGFGSAPRRSPGSLVRVKLMNVVETYSTAPVHAQIIDSSLGDGLKGGTLIGDATPDSTFERISISFRYARDPKREGNALPICARALSLNGTLGLEAEKKEGFVARSAIGSAALGSQDLQKGSGKPNDLQGLLLRALTAGLFQELGTSTQVERNRAQVLKLDPATEFYAELTDFFPGATK